MLADNSKWNFKRKKQRFTSLGNLTIVTPSKWLSELVKQSFLKNYPVKVINNGIDLERFKPTQGNFREKYNLKDKFILLGVANVWEPRKGLKYMLELANRLDDSYQVIVLGVTEKQRQSLPENVLGILKTHNLQELAEIYTAADVYVNPTLEDNFPTTNLEALACGTPVVTFNTGGSTESIDDTCGIAVEKGRADALEDAIMHVRSGESTLDACVKRAGMFDQTNAYLEYLRLYEKLLR